MEPTALEIANRLAEIADHLRGGQDRLVDELLEQVRLLADLAWETPRNADPISGTQSQEVDSLRTRCQLLETHVGALRAQLESASSDNQALRQEIERLRGPIIRYGIACAAVDLQQALRRRLPSESHAADSEPLEEALRDEQSASEALRQLARSLQAPGMGRNG